MAAKNSTQRSDSTFISLSSNYTTLHSCFQKKLQWPSLIEGITIYAISNIPCEEAAKVREMAKEKKMRHPRPAEACDELSTVLLPQSPSGGLFRQSSCIQPADALKEELSPPFPKLIHAICHQNPPSQRAGMQHCRTAVAAGCSLSLPSGFPIPIYFYPP